MRLASPPKTLTVTNTGAGPITVNAVKVTTHFAATHACDDRRAERHLHDRRDFRAAGRGRGEWDRHRAG
jgi:hypothetical protein